MITALAIGCAVLALAAAIFFGSWRSAEAEKARTEDARKQAVAALAAARVATTDQNSRLEKVIADAKREIAELEDEVGRCNQPDVVRDRLRRLLIDLSES